MATTKAFFNYVSFIAAAGEMEEFRRFLYLGVAAGNCYIHEIGRPDVKTVRIAPHKAIHDLIEFIKGGR